MLDYLGSTEFAVKLADNRFVLIFLVIFLIRVKYATYRSMWLTALIEIPGTFLHEMMHFIVGLLLNAKPTSFTLIPKKNESGGYTMGSVGFRNIKFYNAIPAAMAPLLLLPIGIYIDVKIVPKLSPSILNYILYVLFQTIIIENAIPSRTDFKLAFKSFLGIFLFALIVGGFFIVGKIYQFF